MGDASVIDTGALIARLRRLPTIEGSWVDAVRNEAVAALEQIASDERFAADGVIDDTAARIAGLVGPNDEAQAVDKAVRNALLFMRSLANLRLQKLQALSDAALAFIDSHVADPDITDEMAEKWARLQSLRPTQEPAR
ncbi:hypothetical protein [Bosea sp. BK604]|uniref:hypothetical protein n=1 Tax=Bosea sp. BK604 TaxID=2512180 RepID=UPI00104BA437|nr:hypothetical protein [Bosea sp. BK604]TCR64658.1 hypothetical protein EV560_106123 [Bosea sp. BK604]